MITNFNSHEVHCSPLGFVDSFDHEAILSKIRFRRPLEESVTSTLWQWEAADRSGLLRSLAQWDWANLLGGDVDVDGQLERFTATQVGVQVSWVQHKLHKSRDSDQPWFEPRCRDAFDTNTGPGAFTSATPPGTTTSATKKQPHTWRPPRLAPGSNGLGSKRRKLRDSNVGTKQCWEFVKDSEGEEKESIIPPLHTDKGGCALTTQDKSELLAQYFSQKMIVSSPVRPPTTILLVAGVTLSLITPAEGEMRAALSALDETKALGPDAVSPRLLRRCAIELTDSFTYIF